MKRWTVIVIFLAFLAVLAGCSQQTEEQEPAETATTETTETTETTPAPMDTTQIVQGTCAVCGCDILGEAPYTTEHEGVTYSFCSEGCRNLFMDEPGKYIQ